jgi:hypothetical protein
MTRISFRTGLLCATFGLLATQALPSLASASDPSTGNLHAAPAEVSGPINQGKAKSMVGVWTLSFDWGCTGATGFATWTVLKDGSYSDNGGAAGTWTQAGSAVTLSYDTGAVYSGTQKKNAAKGTMTYPGGYTGCWTAVR